MIKCLSWYQPPWIIGLETPSLTIATIFKIMLGLKICAVFLFNTYIKITVNRSPIMPLSDHYSISGEWESSSRTREAKSCMRTTARPQPNDNGLRRPWDPILSLHDPSTEEGQLADGQQELTWRGRVRRGSGDRTLTGERTPAGCHSGKALPRSHAESWETLWDTLATQTMRRLEGGHSM